MVSQFGSLGYTIMGKTADLTVVQKTIIDTLHKEEKPQTFITKEAVCSQSAVSKHVNRKLSGRKKCGRFGSCPHCRKRQKHLKLVKWAWCWCAWLASKLTRPEDNLRGIVKRKMRNKRPKNADELKATVKETWASTPPQQCHKLITSMPRRIETVIKAKEAPTKYWVHMQ